MSAAKETVSPGRYDLRTLLRPHLPALALAFVASLGEAAANLAEPWPIKLVLDNVLQGKPSKASWVLGRSTFSTARRIRCSGMAVAAVIVIAIVGSLFCSTWRASSPRAPASSSCTISAASSYARMQRLSLSFHDRAQTGDLISRVTSDVDAVQTFVANGLLGALVDVLTLTGMVAVMACVDWSFTLIALSIVPPLFALVYTYTRKIKKASREVRKKEGQIVAVIQEVLSSIRVVKAFSREDYEVQRMNKQSLDSVETALRARSLKARLSPLVDVLVAIGTALVLWFSQTHFAGELDAGTLVVFLLYLGKMYKPIQDLSKITDSWSKASVGYERILEVLDTESLREKPGAKNAPRFRGDIEFSHVDFENEQGQPVLRDFDLKIPAGGVFAFVGPTGAGKSSIAGLIARFYEPASGTVSIDGKDIRIFTLKSLRDQVSFVLQDTVLFHGPIWENIAYGKPGATRKEIERAAQLANARRVHRESKLPKATTPWSASAALRFPAASASASGSHAP